MRLLGIAIWLVTSDRKVLLQQKNLRNTRIEIFQPIEGWVGSSELTDDRKKSLISEEFGEAFGRQYSIRQLTEIRKVPFLVIGQGMATRHHFLGQITDQQLAVIPSEKFRLVGKEDLPKIKKLSENNKDPKKDIVLFKQDYEILLGIFGTEGE